ncbi:MAG: hypothetical protein P8R38_01930 [Planctomycetota bacterium]|nr:hypothetical protein [Planctomycetota bacterium]MDG2084202.1 hypothetical protein [Planctomycetota bacterium]
MKKFFLWLLIFIQPLLFSAASWGLTGLLYRWRNPPDGSGIGFLPHDLNTIIILVFGSLLFGLVVGIRLSFLIYRRHLSTKHSAD